MQIKHKTWIALLPICIALISSCEKNECGFGNVDADYVIFGHFYGECFGEGCVEIFKVDDKTLLEDTLDMYPNRDEFYPGQFATQWDNGKFELVKDLKTYFPEELLNETNPVIGQPDAGDWGGIYFELKRGSTHRFWILDQNDNYMPAIYNSFVDRINEKIAIINH